MNRQRIDLGGQWKRSVSGRAIDFVDVPGSYPPMGQCVLERSFDCPWPAADAQSRYFLCTDGVLAAARFTVNGQFVGAAGPWAPYRLEIPAGLLREHNVVQAEVRDMLEPLVAISRRFDGGLIRDIWIERRGRCFIDTFTFRAELDAACESARCTVQVECDGPAAGQIEARLVEKAGGRQVAAASGPAGQALTFTVDRPRLWSPREPNLYVLTVALAGDGRDEASEAVGFRRIEIRGRDFFLNNDRLVLKGVCRHEFTEAHGYSPPVEVVRRDLALIKHAGFNYIRMVHSPQSPVVARLAAELGLLVSEEPGIMFSDMQDPRLTAPAVESLRRLVRRDRNVPSVFAWLIYNECSPNVAYAVAAAGAIRELDPGALISFADCSGKDDEIRAMVRAAGLSYYGVNWYGYQPEPFVERMKVLDDLPLVYTEWGGLWGQGNPRVFADLCAMFARHVQPDQAPRVAGCSYWVWADFEERSRGTQRGAPDGYTIEGLLDKDGRVKSDLQTISLMCFEMDHPAPLGPPKVEVLAKAPLEAGWNCVPLDEIAGDQSELERQVAASRRFPFVMPKFGRLAAGGIEFECRDTRSPLSPLLLGKGRGEIVIPVGRRVRGIAVLGHVTLKGGYPHLSEAWYRTPDWPALPCELGKPASLYELVFEDGSETHELRHGIEMLRGDNYCHAWTIAPRSAATLPAVQTVLHVAYEVLRFDLWRMEFPQVRRLRAIRWRLADEDSIQALLALSVLE
jgi:hypothetical protein